MSENEALLLDLDRLAVRPGSPAAPASPPCCATPQPGCSTKASPLTAQHKNPQQNNDFRAGGVCSARPGAAGAPPTPPPFTPAAGASGLPAPLAATPSVFNLAPIDRAVADALVPPLPKTNGLAAPWKPRLPAQVAIFAALWNSRAHPLASIAAYYGVSKRTLQTWRRRFGLRRRDEVTPEEAATAALAAGIMPTGVDMAKLAEEQREFLRAQTVLGVEIGVSDDGRVEVREAPRRGRLRSDRIG